MQASPTLVPRLRRIANAAYGLVAVLAALALWGWVVDVPALRDLGAQAAPMPPAAALALLLIAGGFTARQRGQNGCPVSPPIRWPLPKEPGCRS